MRRFMTNTPPPPEESSDERQYDELNNATFGDEAMAELEDEFNFFSKSPLQPPPPIIPLRGPKSPPIMARGVNVITVDSLEASFLHNKNSQISNNAAVATSQDELPPGMAPTTATVAIPSANNTAINQHSPSVKKLMTLEEIEAKLQRTCLLAQETQKRWFQIHNGKSAEITFTSSPDDALMTPYEQEGISRIHLGQLSTEIPEVEDYYYRAVTRRRAEVEASGANDDKQGSIQPVFIPLPRPKRLMNSNNNSSANNRGGAGEQRKEVDKEREKNRAQVREALASSLGRISKTSSRRPRQQLQVPQLSMVTSTTTPSSTIYSLPAIIESLYEGLLTLDSIYNAKQPNQEEAAVQRKALEKIINDALLSDLSNESLISNDSNGDLLHHLLSLLNSSKFRKVYCRCIKVLGEESPINTLFIDRIISFFEYLDICRPEALLSEINEFINSVLASMVPFITTTDVDFIEERLGMLSRKDSLPWIVSNKAGVVLCCILLSRLEIIKTTDEDSPMLNNFFDQIQDRLSEVITATATTVEDSLYGWQFMALLALGVDAERKKTMVLDLREKILVVVEGNDFTAVSHLNIFLNALGLDASQLS